LDLRFLICSFSLQALTYRVGHHSTSDDSTKYRPANEIEWWKLARDPVSRFRKWIESNGWWSSEAESDFRSSVREQVKLTYLPKQLQDNICI
jgi:2-oxoisovalerate dehydrogenase E1 component alpha subunit